MTNLGISSSTPDNTRDYSHHRFSLAPMMDWSDRHCRYFWRLLTKHARLYTEMVTTGAIIHGDRARFLDFSAEEQPLALQLGGSNPKDLAECAKIAEDWGYSEVNLNCGCPSDRVQENKIGACLMGEPDTVAECIAAMREVVSIPVTVKHRIGIDDIDSYESLHNFVSTIAATGCDVFIVHARKAWLQGLSPKQNREIPPLEYERVYQLKQDFPQLTFSINGGIKTLDEAKHHLEHVDGLMIGREAYHNPYMLAEVDSVLFGEAPSIPSRDEVLEQMIEYADKHVGGKVRLHHITRHILGLYLGQPGARLFRRYISENAPSATAGVEVITAARKAMEL